MNILLVSKEEILSLCSKQWFYKEVYENLQSGIWEIYHLFWPIKLLQLGSNIMFDNKFCECLLSLVYRSFANPPHGLKIIVNLIHITNRGHYCIKGFDTNESASCRDCLPCYMYALWNSCLWECGLLHLPGVVALSDTAEFKLCFSIGTLISQRLGWRTLNSLRPPTGLKT